MFEELIDHLFNVSFIQSSIICGDLYIGMSRPNKNTADPLSEHDVYDLKLLSKVREFTRETKQTNSIIDLVLSNTNLQTKVLKRAITDPNTIKKEITE